MKRLLWICSLTYLLIGLTHIILGSILAEVLEYYGRSYTDGGILIATQSIGFFIGVISSSLLIKYIGRRNVIVFAALSIAISQFAFFLLLPWHFWLLIAIFTGFGFGIIEPLVGSLIIDASKEKTAIAFSKLEVYFGIGSLIMPLLSGWLAVTGLWRYSFLVLGLYSTLIGVMWMRMSFGNLNRLLDKIKVKTSKPGKLNVGHDNNKKVLIGFIIFFTIYVGLEISIMNFLPSILISNLKANIFEATISVTVFWGAMVIGRLLAGYLAEQYGYARYLICSSIGTVLFIGIIGFTKYLWLSYILISLIGLMMAGIFGIGIVYVNEILIGNTEKYTSIMIAFGSVGGILIPLLTGGFIDHFSIIIVSITLATLAFIMVIMIILIQKTEQL